MALFDFLTGGSAKKKPPAGPHVTRDRQEAERKERLASMQGQYDEQNKKSAADKAAKGAADAAAKEAERKKKAKAFWGKVLGKNDG